MNIERPKGSRKSKAVQETENESSHNPVLPSRIDISVWPPELKDIINGNPSYRERN